MAMVPYGYGTLWPRQHPMTTAPYGHNTLWPQHPMAMAHYGHGTLWPQHLMATAPYGHDTLWPRHPMATAPYGYGTLWSRQLTAKGCRKHGVLVVGDGHGPPPHLNSLVVVLGHTGTRRERGQVPGWQDACARVWVLPRRVHEVEGCVVLGYAGCCTRTCARTDAAVQTHARP